MPDLRVCAVIRERTIDEVIRKLKMAERRVDMAEVRLDRLGDEEDTDRLIWSTKLPVVISNRRKRDGGSWRGKEKRRIDQLLRLTGDFAYVDIETDVQEKSLMEAVTRSKELGTEVIVSYHNTKRTPPLKRLLKIFERAKRYGSIVKIATKVRKFEDNLVLFDLIHKVKDMGDIIAVGMGPLGKPARALGPLMGSFLTYATIEESELMTVRELRRCWDAF